MLETYDFIDIELIKNQNFILALATILAGIIPILIFIYNNNKKYRDKYIYNISKLLEDFYFPVVKSLNNSTTLVLDENLQKEFIKYQVYIPSKLCFMINELFEQGNSIDINVNINNQTSKRIKTIKNDLKILIKKEIRDYSSLIDTYNYELRNKFGYPRIGDCIKSFLHFIKKMGLYSLNILSVIFILLLLMCLKLPKIFFTEQRNLNYLLTLATLFLSFLIISLVLIVVLFFILKIFDKISRTLDYKQIILIKNQLVYNDGTYRTLITQKKSYYFKGQILSDKFLVIRCRD